MARGITLDSSVIVKWFKKGEEFEEEAMKLKQDALSSTRSISVSELAHLEVCRALVKAKYANERVREVYSTLSEMFELGFLTPITVTMLKDKAKDLVVELNLHVADALSLAVALVSSSDLLTEDQHLLKPEVKGVMEKQGLKVTRLKELYL